MQITTEHVEIPVNGAAMGAHVAYPTEGGPHAAVIVFMEIFGVNSHIRDVTERLAREGYVAVAPDFFHRTAPGIELSYTEEDMGKGFVPYGQLQADEMIVDARAAIAWLRERDDVRGERIGCMGFCVGGHMTYLTACETDVAAAASFYGGGIAGAEGFGGADSTLGRTGKIRGRILCLFGDRDEYIPAAEVEQIKAELDKHEIRSECVLYPGVGHGFFCDQRDSYSEEAAADAWQKVVALFAEELKG
jgi:carboxymethylenebutenolidase